MKEAQPEFYVDQYGNRIADPIPREGDVLDVGAGALGGKISGAGGGGFLLLYCPYERREAVRAALKDFQELPFQLEPDGSKVIFNYRR